MSGLTDQREAPTDEQGDDDERAKTWTIVIHVYFRSVIVCLGWFQKRLKNIIGIPLPFRDELRKRIV